MPIDCDELRRLYVDERMTSTQIAAHLGIPRPTIISRMAACAIPARQRPLTAEEMSDDILRSHVEAGQGDLEIACLVNVSERAVRERRKASGIVRKRRSRRYKPPPKTELQRLVDEGETFASLGRRYGVPARAVDRWMRRFEIDYPHRRPRNSR